MFDSSILYLRIAPDRFHYLKFILEGYDNLAILSSFDNRQGVVMLRFTPSTTRDVLQLLTAISPSLKP